MSTAKTLKILKKIEEIPTLPAIITQVIKIANDPKSTADSLNKIITKDQSLTSKTLKLVNSAYYGFPRTINKITEAVVILGFNTIKSLAMSVSVCELFSDETDVEGFSLSGLWRHSVSVGICSELIGKHIKHPLTEELFILGLLHDVGLVVECQYFREDFVECLRAAKSGKVLQDVEKEIIGIDHGLIGKKVTEQWKLPKMISSVVGFHHQPKFAYGDTKELTSIVYFADIICRLKKIGTSGSYIMEKLQPEAFEAIKFKKEDIKIIASQIDSAMEKAKDFLDLTKE